MQHEYPPSPGETGKEGESSKSEGDWAASEFWAAEDKAAYALSQLIGTPGFASEITADRRTRA